MNVDVLRWGSDGAAEAAFGDFLLRRGEDEGQDAGGMPRLAGHRAEWWRAISAGLRHPTYLLVLRDRDDVLGVLPLMLVKGPLFGKFLVSLPYLNTGGVFGGGAVDGVDEARSACADSVGGGGDGDEEGLELGQGIGGGAVDGVDEGRTACAVPLGGGGDGDEERLELGQGIGGGAVDEVDEGRTACAVPLGGGGGGDGERLELGQGIGGGAVDGVDEGRTACAVPLGGGGGGDGERLELGQGIGGGAVDGVDEGRTACAVPLGDGGDGDGERLELGQGIGGGSVCGVDEGRTACAVPLGDGVGVGAGLLVDQACAMADELDVRYLELRHEVPVEGHSKLNFSRTDKVHMRLALPASDEALDKSFKSKLRSQVRKAGQSELTVVWGGEELLSDFYSVFAVNMRDLGTPVFSRRLFAATLKEFAGSAELCVVRKDGQAVAGALLVHCDGVTEVPSASCLRAFNYTGANMWMYRHLLARAIEKQSHTFDFGRSSVSSGTYKFKAQWGAEPFPAVWQYYIRKGSADAMRPDSDGNQKLIKIWQRLPVWVTKLMGPEIVRGIP